MPLEGVSGASDMGGVECQAECSNLGMFGVLSATQRSLTPQPATGTTAATETATTVDTASTAVSIHRREEKGRHIIRVGKYLE